MDVADDPEGRVRGVRQGSVQEIAELRSQLGRLRDAASSNQWRYHLSFGQPEEPMNRILLTLALLLSMATYGVRAQDYRAYQNYDFVAGDKIIFEDDFSSTQDGEFPAPWKLLSGQAVVNKVAGEPAL